MDKAEVRLSEWIEKGFNLYKQNFGVLVLASLIACVISAVTLGILSGPMFAGMLLITLRLFDNEEPKPEVGQVFKGFDFFLNSFLFVLVWGVAFFLASLILAFIPFLGQILSIFLFYAAQTALMFGLFLIVDRKMDFWPASVESFNRVKTNFWPFFGLSVVSGIIGGIGAIVCGIGIVITAPIHACILTVAYRSVFSESGTESNKEDKTPLETEEELRKEADRLRKELEQLKKADA